MNERTTFQIFLFAFFHLFALFRFRDTIDRLIGALDTMLDMNCASYAVIFDFDLDFVVWRRSM